jgi:SAM-dependent methyltransferase
LEAKLKAILGKGSCVVDLGCGSGHLLRALGDRFDQRIGLDLTGTRLDTLAGGNTDGWEFREADLNGIFPLADASADAVIANQVIEHILDPIKFVREIHRILRPGGAAS